MSFVPMAVPASGKHEDVGELRWPDDAKRIKGLNLTAKQVWYAAQDPQKLVESNVDFHQFWYWHYVFPLKLKRFLYVFKFW